MNDQNLWQKFIWLSERAILMIIAIATLFATGIELARMFDVQTVNLSDLFLLFIYAEVLGMVGAFYINNRLPVTCLLYTSPSPRDRSLSRMPSSA